jgi:hypothetical protein
VEGRAAVAYGAYPMSRGGGSRHRLAARAPFAFMAALSPSTPWRRRLDEESIDGPWGRSLLQRLVYDGLAAGAARLDEMGFVSGMVMGMARRDRSGPALLQLRAMLSPDPLMGRRGYPLHLASGETADGVDPLIDRQHPHDLFMELSASYSLASRRTASLFLYAGLPGEPAFGPPAFMHRMSIMDSPEAPISHHWLDSTHITFGVVTAGLVVGTGVKLEASRFNGREPDQHRYDIETGPLDSTALRLSWNPTPNLSLQASWAHLVEPGAARAGREFRRAGRRARSTPGRSAPRLVVDDARLGPPLGGDDAFVLESAVGPADWTLFGRAERTENDELARAAITGPTFDVGKVSLGALRDFRVAPHVRLGVGGLLRPSTS